MSNPISNDLGVTRVQGRTGTRVSDDAGPEAARSNQTARESRSDRVTLTDDARRIDEVLSQALDSSDVDAARVESLRESIDSGQYEVDAQRVAEKFAAFESGVADATDS